MEGYIENLVDEKNNYFEFEMNTEVLSDNITICPQILDINLECKNKEVFAGKENIFSEVIELLKKISDTSTPIKKMPKIYSDAFKNIYCMVSSSELNSSSIMDDISKELSINIEYKILLESSKKLNCRDNIIKILIDDLNFINSMKPSTLNKVSRIYSNIFRIKNSNINYVVERVRGGEKTIECFCDSSSSFEQPIGYKYSFSRII